METSSEWNLALREVEQGRRISEERRCDPTRHPICGKSVSEDKEYGGMLFKKGDRFGFGAPRRGNQHDMGAEFGLNNDLDAANYMKMLPPPGVEMVGTYHTHGAESGRGDEAISDNDAHASYLLNLAGYVGTPTGRVLVYDPRDLYLKNPLAEDFGFGVGTVPCK